MNKNQLREFILCVPDKIYYNWLDNATTEELELADEIFKEMNRSGARPTPNIENVELASMYLKKFTLKGI
jgi:hypothetical protein